MIFFLLFLCWLQSEYCVNHFRKEVLIFFFYVLKCSNKLKTHRHLSLLVNLTTSGPPQPAQRRRNAPDVLLLFLVWIICVAKNMWNKKSPGSITLTLFKTSFKAVFSASEVEEKFLCRSDPCCCCRSRCLRGNQDQTFTGSTSSSLLDTRRRESDEACGNFRGKKPRLFMRHKSWCVVDFKQGVEKMNFLGHVFCA